MCVIWCFSLFFRSDADGAAVEPGDPPLRPREGGYIAAACHLCRCVFVVQWSRVEATEPPCAPDLGSNPNVVFDFVCIYTGPAVRPPPPPPLTPSPPTTVVGPDRRRRRKTSPVYRPYRPPTSVSSSSVTVKVEAGTVQPDTCQCLRYRFCRDCGQWHRIHRD